MEYVSFTFILFIIYAFLGWIVEVIYSFFETKKIVNRGFLIGPYCPIYGVGVLLILWFLKKYQSDVLAVFILASAICMILEYVTSFVMEKLYNARWWDYSNMKFNINGRVCLETTIPFGLGGLLILYVVNPFVEGLVLKLGSHATIVGIILMVIFFTDVIISASVISKIRSYNFGKLKDSTEKVNTMVKEYLMNHSILTKRLIESFPDFRVIIKNIKSKIKL